MLPQLEAPAVISVDTAPAAPAAKPAPDFPLECEHLADVPLRVEAVLDRLTMNMRAVASLEEGALIALGRSAGDNVDLCVAGVALASAEIVVIEDRLGARITDLLTGE